MYKIITILIMMLNPVYKCHDIFKIELNIKKKNVYEHSLVLHA